MTKFQQIERDFHQSLKNIGEFKELLKLTCDILDMFVYLCY